MTEEHDAPQSAVTVRTLLELVAALDRRVPQVQRVGEAAIARAAATLRAAALNRVKELDPEHEGQVQPVLEDDETDSSAVEAGRGSVMAAPDADLRRR